MEYTPALGRECLVDDVLDRVFPDDTKPRNYAKTPISNKHTTDHSRFEPETPESYSSRKDWRSAAKQSPISFSTSENSLIPSVKNLTCYFWLRHGKCKWTDEECLYAHYHTGKAASGPVQVEQGKPAVAGKNASNTHPVYLDWRAGLSQPNGNNVSPGIQQHIDFIKSKAHEQNLDIIKHQFDVNNNIMGLGIKPGQCELVDNYQLNHIEPHESLTLPASHKPAELPPQNPYSSVYHVVGGPQQPALRVRTNRNLSDEYASYPRFITQDQQSSQARRQMICFRPMDHLKPSESSYQLYQALQTMAAKDKVVCQLAQALDVAIENMELQQQGAAKEVQMLLSLAKSQMVNEGLSRDLTANDIGYGTQLHSPATTRDFAPVHVSAYHGVGNGNSQLCQPNRPNVASKITDVGDNLMHLMQREKFCVDHLNAVKENVGHQMAVLGGGVVLPKGWLSYDLSIQ